MTLHTPVGPATPDGLARDPLKDAWELYDIAAAIMRQVIEEARAKPYENARDLALYTKDVRDALKLLIGERAGLEKLRRDAGGLGADPVFDFDAARDEIGRRLACLRDAGGG